MSMPPAIRQESQSPPPPAAEEKLPRSTLVYFALPTLALGFGESMMSFYYLKFATDVLLIAPVAMGLIFAVSRVWDGFTDPIVGYSSDRTRSRLGRRRPWMLASALPLGLLFVAMWIPPAALDKSSLTIWVGVSVLFFFMASTTFRIPHAALGVELCLGYHERTRLFTYAGLVGGVGSMIGLAALAWMMFSEIDERVGLGRMAVVVALFGALLTVVSVWRLRERGEYQDRGTTSSRKAIRDVWSNHHARRLMIVSFIESTGLGGIATMVPFACQYLYGDAKFMPILLSVFAISQLFGLPIWSPLSRRFGKQRVWLVARGIEVFAILCFSLIGLVGGAAYILVFAAIVGVLEGVGNVLEPSMRADVIDFDEYRSGERKEGSYMAAWGMVGKGSIATSMLLIGSLMSASGFIPNEVQSPSAEWALRALFSLLPATLLAIAWFVMRGFKFNEAEHAEAVSHLDRES